MKIRILGNSLRFRLTQSEVCTLQENREIYETVDFPGTVFTYGIRLVSTENIGAVYENNTICILLPESLSEPWLTTDQVGISHELERSGLPELHLLVEKDFVCLVPREGEEDMFPNPRNTHD